MGLQPTHRPSRPPAIGIYWKCAARQFASDKTNKVIMGMVDAKQLLGFDVLNANLRNSVYAAVSTICSKMEKLPESEKPAAAYHLTDFSTC